MRRLHALAVLVSVLALSLVISGCGGQDDAAGKKKKRGQLRGSGEGQTAKEYTELDSKGWGTLSGTVTYDGDPPTPALINMTGNQDKDKCHATKEPEQDLRDPTWVVDPKNKGVANVVIFLRPGEGKIFKIKDEDKKRDNLVELKQPFCAFHPHVSVHFPAYRDRSDQLHPTGEKFKVTNDAKFTHNASWAGDPDKIAPGNVPLAPEASKTLSFQPDANTPVSFKCDIHGWMNAKVWVLDHPYAAVTDKNGKFTLKNVPAGAELYVVGWHEGVGYFKETGAEGKKVTLKDGDNTMDFKISKR